MIMYLNLAETTVKTILETILKISIKNFSYIKYLAFLQLVFKSVITFSKNLSIRYFLISAMFLYF